MAEKIKHTFIYYHPKNEPIPEMVDMCTIQPCGCLFLLDHFIATKISGFVLCDTCYETEQRCTKDQVSKTPDKPETLLYIHAFFSPSRDTPKPQPLNDGSSRKPIRED
jgi:hypothetical protein